jgi:hypothetical protein
MTRQNDARSVCREDNRSGMKDGHCWWPDNTESKQPVKGHDVGTCIAHARLAWYHRSNAVSPSWNVV